MNRLNIKLHINSACELCADDITNYDSAAFNDVDYDSHISIEGIIGLRDKVADISTINCKRFVKLPNHVTKNFTKIIFPKDGTFTYYKILVPKLSHFVVYPTGDMLYYNDVEGTKNFGQLCYYNHVKETVIHPTDIRKIAEYSSLPNVICFEQIVFTACKLQKCLVNLQRKTLDNVLCGKCTDNKLDLDNRDMLLSAMYVLDYLKDRSEFEKAQEILDTLSMCQLCDCNGLDYSNCGCNK